jgi:PTS system beta-glucosides-specific IIC component
MAKKVRDYKKLAADIKDAIGESNILTATHCATRLRLVLKEAPDESVTKKIEQMPAVIQVVQAGGQYQVVIGTHAKDVYEHLAGMMTFSQDAPEIKESLINRVIAMMSGCIAPFVYVLAAAGLLQGVLIIIRLFVDISGTGANQIYDMISWTPFTFLPVFIAVAGSRHFKCNPYIALWCCLALTNPTWATIAASISEGTPLKFLFIPLTSVTYTSTVIPPIVLVAVLSWVEHKIEKIIPDTFRAIGTPFLCTVIMVPLTIIVIGPVSTILANGLANAYNALYAFLPWLASAILGAVWQILVVFGVHWSFTPLSIANYANIGFDQMQPYMGIAVCAQTAACFGVFLKSRNSEIKNVAVSSAATGLFGITEPAIYGVTLRFKKPFICGCIAGAIGSVVASFFNARYFVYAGLTGFLSIPNSIYNEAAQQNCEALGTAGNYSSAVFGVLIGTAVACVLAVILVQFVGFDDPVEIPEEDDADSEAADAAISDVTVSSPMNGELVELSKVPDAAFADGILGQGVAILPSEGRLYSPVDATVSSVFDTKHAIALTTDSGAEMLIHVGLDTVSLNGKYFTPRVKDGDKVKAGDLLLEFDLESIKKEFKTFTPVLVTNADDYSSVDVIRSSGPVKVGEPIYTAKA